MNRLLVAVAATAVVTFALACGSGSDEGPVASLPTADISSFPTPSGSQATRPPEPEPTAPPNATQSGEVSDDTGGDPPETTEVTPEELQELRARLQSGELNEEEAQELIQRLREQFGGGQGGPGLGGFGPGGLGGSQAAGTIESVDGNTITVATELSSVTVILGENTAINTTSLLEPSALADDTTVMVISERVEGSNLARTITDYPRRGGRIRPRRGWTSEDSVAVRVARVRRVGLS